MGRKRFERFEPRNRLNKPNLFAAGCHPLPPKSHGKKGSTVRVRRRALQRSRKAGLLLSGPLARSTVCGGYGALCGAFRSRSVFVRAALFLANQNARSATHELQLTPLAENWTP
jgi:hypothetical protein